MEGSNLLIHYKDIDKIAEFAQLMTDVNEMIKFVEEENSKLDIPYPPEELNRLINALSKNIIETQKEFNSDRCLEELKKIIPKAEESDRIQQALEFIKKQVLSKEGDVTEIELFIEYIVFHYFSIPTGKNNKAASILRKGYADILKSKRKQQASNEITGNSEESDQVIDPEFTGLYLYRKDSNTGEVSIIPYPDKIADFVVETMHVLSYKDMVFCYDKEAGYFKENYYSIEAEVTRILNGILKETRSNGVIRKISDVMKYISHKNRYNYYPFKNEHKVIPVKNGILKINPETWQITLEDPDPAKYKLNYVFPIIFDPRASTEPIIDELTKYVSDPRAIIQIMAQTVTQTLVEQPYKKAYFCYGQPDYGKSMIVIELIENRFINEDSNAKIPLERLSNDVNNKFSIASLEGKLMNIKDEMSFFSMKDANTFKEITGSFSIWAEHKGKMGYKARSTAVHLFAGNKLPKFDTKIKEDDGFWERVNLLDFNMTKFKRDTKAAERIFTNSFMSGLLNLVLEMVIEILRSGELPVDQPWEEAREEWLKNSNEIYKFITENMSKSPDKPTAVLKKDLLRQVQLWFDENFTDKKSRPNSVEDLTETIKLCGGSLDERRMFEITEYDRDTHRPVYEKDKDGIVKLDENSNPIEKKVKKELHCYILPWSWNSGNKYGLRIKKCVTEDGEDEDYQ